MRSVLSAVLLPVAMAVVIVGLAIVSIFVGVTELSIVDVVSGDIDGLQGSVLIESRLPRTLALALAGTGLSVTGLILQMLVRNKFVEPSTVGATEAATLGMLAMLLFAPDMTIFARMLVAATAALAGTMVFLRILSAVPLRSVLMVPLIGILYSGVIAAITTFFAYRFDLLQSLGAWSTGDFSIVLRGRYEMLWISAVLVVLAYVAADRFTVAGLGRDFATNLGLDHRKVMGVGLVIVSLISAAVVVTVGVIPFLGLVVPNVVSMTVGDNVRRSLPMVALLGAGLVLACDIAGRLINQPYEIPIGTMMGVIGSVGFLLLILRKSAHVA